MSNVDFSTVTEVTGYKVTSEQLQRMYTRYRFAAEYCEGKDVLEIACGTGQGLGYLAKTARRVVGGDFDETIVSKARDHYQDRIAVTRMDAQNLPFTDASFDAVLCFEAIYYFDDPARFISEARRVLRKDGILLICTANKDWSGFNPSPFSHTYFSAPELHALLVRQGFRTELFADCPVGGDSLPARVISLIKQSAVKLHLMPKTMKGKELLKRLFMGKLRQLPPEVDDGMGPYLRPTPITHELPVAQFKVLFAVGHAN
ncbi:MAG: methyltransferase domain-containing protein [Nitrospirota bacterium]